MQTVSVTLGSRAVNDFVREATEHRLDHQRPVGARRLRFCMESVAIPELTSKRQRNQPHGQQHGLRPPVRASPRRLVCATGCR